MKKKSQKQNSFTIRRAKNTLRRFLVPFFRRFKPKQETVMLLPNVRKVIVAMRERSRQVRENNKKIDEWVDQFINRSALKGEAITLLTQWCISKDLEIRYREQGKFIPTKGESRLFGKELLEVVDVFKINGLSLNWIITFNRSYLDSGRIQKTVESAYKNMIAELAQPLVQEGWLVLLDWEDDVLGKRPEPDSEVCASPQKFVAHGALALEIERHSAWARNEAGLTQSDEELKRDVYYQIACEAREGELLDDSSSPIGECILVPLESPERYDFFTLKAPKFKGRIVSVLKPYPWRV